MLGHLTMCNKTMNYRIRFSQDSEIIKASVFLIPSRTFLVRFRGISDEFDRAMVRILARRSPAKIPMSGPNQPDMLPKRTKKGAIRCLPYPNSS